MASPPATHDAARRAFFLQFGRQAVTAAGQVASVAGIVGRGSGGLADLLGLDAPAASERGPRFIRSPGRAAASQAPPAAEAAFRSAYRRTADGLAILDQRALPESMEEVTVRRGADVAYYLRLGAVHGGPLMAQLAAYGLALTAEEGRERHPAQQEQELRRTRQALVAARPSARLIGWAAERLDAVLRSAGEAPEAAPRPVDAAALWAEADAVARDLAEWNAAIAARLAELLAGPAERPLAILLHGGHGALHGGVVGSGLPALRAARDGGRQLEVYVTEGRPWMDGARLTSWELRQAGIGHRLIPDAAVAWLLQHQRIDAALLAADWMTAAGDVGAVVGSGMVAQLARAAGVRVIVTGVSATLDPATPDGGVIPRELWSAREMVAYLASVPVAASDALVPASDVVPASTISALVTERGVVMLEGG